MSKAKTKLGTKLRKKEKFVDNYYKWMNIW